MGALEAFRSTGGPWGARVVGECGVIVGDTWEIGVGEPELPEDGGRREVLGVPGWR